MGDVDLRYFRALPEVYESFRAALDSAYGYPDPVTFTETAIPPASQAPADSFGRAYIAADEQYCNYSLPSVLLQQALSSGQIEEIDEATFCSEPISYRDVPDVHNS